MKKMYLIMLVFALIGGGCGKKKESSSAEDFKTNVEEAVKKIDETSEDLKKATPLSNDKLKEMLPQEIDGINRSGFRINQMGFHVAEADYDGEDKNIKLTIVDGAGETGAAMVTMTQFAINAGGESETDHGYTKPFEMDSMKGMEEQDRSGDDASSTRNKITIIVEDRFVVTLEAYGEDMDKLKNILKDSGILDKVKDAM